MVYRPFLLTHVPLMKEGTIVLGAGGDNRHKGAFFEGAMGRQGAEPNRTRGACS
jgi:hypothetical protein